MRTLILNTDFLPLGTVSHKRAVVLDLNNPHITTLSYYDKTIKSERDDIAIPAVMLYNKYVKIKLDPPITKRNVLKRDQMTCQYCELVLTNSTYSIDHVIPTSRFKNRKESNSWDNMVACCKDCNKAKADRTPKEAGMKLLRPPKKPRYVLDCTSIPDEWKDFIKSP